MYGQLLLKALSDKYNAEISDAMARLNICLGSPQEASDGAGIVELMDELVAQAAAAEQRLLALQRYTSQPESAPQPTQSDVTPADDTESAK